VEREATARRPSVRAVEEFDPPPSFYLLCEDGGTDPRVEAIRRGERGESKSASNPAYR
jgi:hypothetical protein